MGENALSAFRAALGDENVLSDPASLDAASTATFETAARVSVIVRPANRDELLAILRIATEHRTPVYPVSGGKNWGLGSRVPTRDGAALIELGRMNRIIAFDEELAYVTVEPGVTFEELYRFLNERSSRLFMSSTGASPRSSVLANALERGDGSGPYGDRASHVAAIEAVLTTGEVIHTGFDRFGESPIAPLHRYGVGPALDGLFLQSNLAVVTKLTVWLQPLPKYLAAIRFALAEPERLPAVVDAARALKLEGTLRTGVAIWNDYRVLSVEQQFPWQASGGKTPLTRDTLADVTDRFRFFGLASVYAAGAAIGEALVQRVESVLAPLVDDIRVSRRSGDPASGRELFNENDPALAFLQGIPHEQSLKSIYWRKRSPAPADPDPDRDRCGVLWLCPTLPLRGADVLDAAQIGERVLLGHGFEPLLAFVSQTERTAYFFPMIVYDRDMPGADGRARTAHDALLAELVQRGFLPHRLGLASMGALPPPIDDWPSVIQRLKKLFDPADVLAAGRYDFRESWRDD